MLDSAIQTAVRLSRRYLTGRQLPDKAVDLLDTAGARVRMSLDTLPEPLTQLHARLAALDIEREAIEQDCVFYPEASPERLAELTDLRDELQAEAGHLEAQYQQEKALAQQIMTLRQEGTDSTELQQQLRTHQALHRCWRWMWTPAPSPRWWRTGPASRSLPCSKTSRATCSVWKRA